MSKPRRDKHYLADITEAIGRIISYTKDLTYEQFVNRTMVQDAVLRNLQVIGEATKKVSPSLRNANSDIPWREMAGIDLQIIEHCADILLYKPVFILRGGEPCTMNELTGDDKEKPYVKERPTYQKRKGERVRLTAKQALTSLFTAPEGMLMVFCLGGCWLWLLKSDKRKGNGNSTGSS